MLADNVLSWVWLLEEDLQRDEELATALDRHSRFLLDYCGAAVVEVAVVDDERGEVHVVGPSKVVRHEPLADSIFRLEPGRWRVSGTLTFTEEGQSHPIPGDQYAAVVAGSKDTYGRHVVVLVREVRAEPEEVVDLLARVADVVGRRVVREYAEGIAEVCKSAT